MKGFIEVTRLATEQVLCINPQHIVDFGKSEAGITHIILTIGTRSIPVKESYEVVKELIEEALGGRE